MSQRKQLYELSAFRSLYGHYVRSAHPTIQWEQIRPGHSRKTYGTVRDINRWVYMPPILETLDRLKSKKQLEAILDARPLTQLQHEAESALGQMLCRASMGDEKAMAKLIATLRNAVGLLEKLAHYQRRNAAAIAEEYPTWPVLLSLNPQDIDHAKDTLVSLRVGTKALTPTRPGQRIDPRNFWTNLVNSALRACDQCREVVPLLQAHCKDGVRERKTDDYWGIRVRADVYTLNDGSQIIIADWQKRCAKLSYRITERNFAEWWGVVKVCVLENWQNPVGTYSEALKQVGQTDEAEWRRRNIAIRRVQQALRSLLGLH